MKTFTIFEKYKTVKFEWLGSTYSSLGEAVEALQKELKTRGGKLVNGCGEPYKLIIEETEREDGWCTDW